MKRDTDIEALVQQSLKKSGVKDCPFPRLVGDAKTYADAVTALPREDVSGDAVWRVLKQLGAPAAQRRVYAHLDGTCEC
jgi:hypothetical protein